MDLENAAYSSLDPEAICKALCQMPESKDIENLAEFFKVMADPTRIRLLMALESNEFCASDLANLTQMSRSAVSHQLKTLKTAKLIKSRKEGKTVYYSLDDEHIHSVLKVSLTHVLED